MHRLADQPEPRNSDTEVTPLKRLIVLAALLLGTAGAFAFPASADTACVTIHVQINDTVIDQAPCV